MIARTRPHGRGSILVAGLSFTLAAAALAAAPPSQAATSPIACPAAFPTWKAVDGVSGVGYTVERGTTPDPFTATVLGRITDGIAPGVDMIMARLDSAALTRAGGVWAGMSGSPVYSSDGRLIGSVSYGLSAGPTKVAGLTPGASMKPILTQAAASPAKAGSLMRTHVTPSAADQARLVTAGHLTAAQAAGGFTQLAMPLWVSGASSQASKPLFDRLASHLHGTQVFAGGASAPAKAAPADSITAGGNFVSALSYGDATFAGIGTTTFVCGGKAVAFGHPFNFNGATRMSAHPATAVYIQEDPLFGPFKVANPGGVAGTVDLDVLTGIRAQLGLAPASTLITSSFTYAGKTYNGTTHAVFPDFVGDIAAFHTLFNVRKALGSDTPGSGDVTITIKGQRADGSAFTLTRSDRYSSQYAISFAIADQVYGMTATLAQQTFEQVKITSVRVFGSVDPTIRQFDISSVKVKKAAGYVTATDPINAKAGGTIALRLTLRPYLGIGATQTVDLSLPVEAGTAGQSGNLEIFGGAASTFGSEPSTFGELLKFLRALPLNASVHATLDLNGKQTTVTVPVDGAVNFYDASFGVNVS